MNVHLPKEGLAVLECDESDLCCEKCCVCIKSNVGIGAFQPEVYRPDLAALA